MKKLTAKEEEVMQALWKLERAFVKELKAKIPSKLHYNTVSSVVRKLEEKGFVSHEDFGSTYRYYPIISKEDYSVFFMKSATKRFFDNSYKRMVSFFVRENELSKAELQEILALIEEQEKKEKNNKNQQS